MSSLLDDYFHSFELDKHQRERDEIESEEIEKEIAPLKVFYNAIKENRTKEDIFLDEFYAQIPFLQTTMSHGLYLDLSFLNQPHQQPTRKKETNDFVKRHLLFQMTRPYECKTIFSGQTSKWICWSPSNHEIFYYLNLSSSSSASSSGGLPFSYLYYITQKMVSEALRVIKEYLQFMSDLDTMKWHIVFYLWEHNGHRRRYKGFAQ
jgi:hypothetical protein